MSVVKGPVAAFEDWSGGNWGSKGSINADPNQIRAVNMQVYANGSIGPRPGWKELPATVGTAPAPAASGMFRTIWVPGDSTFTNGILLFIARGTAAATKLYDPTTGTWTASTLGVMNSADGPAETNAGSVAYLNPSQLVVKATDIYNPITDVDAAITYPSSFAPNQSVFYRERMYSWGDATFPNRVYYSDAAAFSTFTAGNFFDVGSGGATAASRPAIRGLWPLREGMLILTTANKNQRQPWFEWWYLTGANPVSGSLRRLGYGKGPSYPALCTEYNSKVIGLDFDRFFGGWVHDGSNVDLNILSHLRNNFDSPSFLAGRNAISGYMQPFIVLPYISKTYGDPTATLPSGFGEHFLNGLQAWVLVNGVWTQELWWEGVTDITLTSGFPYLQGITTFHGDKMIAATCTSSDGNGAYRFWSRDICLNRPVIASVDTWSQAIESNSDTTSTGQISRLYLPEIVAPSAAGIRATRVVVEFDYWKNSNFLPASTASMAIQVCGRSLEGGPQYATDEQTSDTGWNLADSSGFIPLRGRYVFDLPEVPFTGMVQLRFTSVINIAFWKVFVYTEVDTEDPS